jgi:GNAT superfamily N-acetyltransferase
MRNSMTTFTIRLATEDDFAFAPAISIEMEASARARGTGIATRTPEYLQSKMQRGQAFIAVDVERNLPAGFCYCEVWSHGKYIANSGLLIFPEYRLFGLARRLKAFAFEESRKRFPEAKCFGLTTSLAVMTINSDLGYRPVTYSELTQDEEFWAGCRSCVNYPTLNEKNRKNCLCTAMLYDPAWEAKRQQRLVEAKAMELAL